MGGQMDGWREGGMAADGVGGWVGLGWSDGGKDRLNEQINR